MLYNHTDCTGRLPMLAWAPLKKELKQVKAWNTFDAENEKNGKNKIDSLASGFATQTEPRTARIQPDCKTKQDIFSAKIIKL